VSAHENASQIELHLETDINISPIDGRTPPESEATIGNLIETRSLSIGKLLISHRLFESRGFLPEQTYETHEHLSVTQGEDYEPSQVGKYVPLKRVCSRMPSTPPKAAITSTR
jgi:hypothetical protein